MAEIESQKCTNVRNQYYATLGVNLIMLAQGGIIGWVAPALPLLASADTPLHSGPLSNNEISWIGSINCFGSIFGSIVFGYVTALMGSKRATLLLAIPSISFWLVIHFGTSYIHVLIANFVGGLVTGGYSVTIILYISEIANNEIRGRLGSMTLLIRNIGILLAYVLGATVDYEYIPWICVFIPIVFVISFSILPNTPQYYIRKGDFEKAEDALTHYKGYDEKNEAFFDEFERLKSTATTQKPDEKRNWSDICNRKSITGLGVGIALVTITQFTASFPIVSYAVIIFANAGTSFDPYVSSIVSAVSFLVGSLHTALLIEVLGRKWLAFISLVGSAVGLFAVSIYLFLKIIGFELSTFSSIPLVCLSLVIFLSSAGITPVSIIWAVEYLPSEIRTFGMAIISVVLSLTGFISVKTFPHLMSNLGLQGCFFIYGLGCILGAIFVIGVLKETSGLSIDDDKNDAK